MAKEWTGIFMQPMMRDAAILAFDTISEKLSKTAAIRGTALAKLLRRWKGLERNEKERVVSVVIATTAAAIAALTAASSKPRRKRVLKKARKAIKRLRK